MFRSTAALPDGCMVCDDNYFSARSFLIEPNSFNLIPEPGDIFCVFVIMVTYSPTLNASKVPDLCADIILVLWLNVRMESTAENCDIRRYIYSAPVQNLQLAPKCLFVLQLACEVESLAPRQSIELVIPKDEKDHFKLIALSLEKPKIFIIVLQAPNITR